MARVIKVVGDARDVDWSALARPQVVVTSPPYWGKRKYPIGDLWWGGVAGCEHRVDCATAPVRRSMRGESPGMAGAPVLADFTGGGRCRCGAWWGQLGQESTPHEYVGHLVDLLCGLPLADDGVMWINIDDTRLHAGGGQPPPKTMFARMTGDASGVMTRPPGPGCDAAALREVGLRSKDSALVPERFAIAMQERGFYVRSKIVWSKSNGMPESVRDRPQHRYEMIFMLTRRPKYKYFSDAVRLPIAPATPARELRARGDDNKQTAHPVYGRQSISKPREKMTRRSAPAATKTLNDVWTLSTANSSMPHIAPMPESIAERAILLTTEPGDWVLDPFAGTGTTCRVAQRLGRNAIGVDLDDRLDEWLDCPAELGGVFGRG